MDKKYLLSFGAFGEIRFEQWEKISGYFPNFKTAWEAKEGDYLTAGLTKKWASKFTDYKRGVKPDKILNDLVRRKVDIISYTDSNYPLNLKEIYNPPYLLYIKGEIKKEDRQAVAIVGSRKATSYGINAVRRIANELASKKITIVSGLAYGIDTAAHKGALAGGRTIAVLANGLDMVYPKENQKLADAISEHGCLISEQPIGIKPEKQNFPTRNRIISGLSLGVLVAEAGEHSGTLHTASFALEQNRQLYAIPGPIDSPLSLGPNELLKRGAIPITKPSDILEDLEGTL